MAWLSEGICYKCGNKGKVYATWGKYICKKCKDSRPNKGSGNSGMYAYKGKIAKSIYDKLTLQKVSKSNPIFGGLFFEHYPKSKGIPGRSLCYLIWDDKKILGIIGVNSPAKNYLVFNKIFGKNNENYFVNNNVFRLIVNEKNLATKVLSMARERIFIDYAIKYNDRLLGIITFVELPRTGALYKADNWNYLGLTKGIRMKRNVESWEQEYYNDIQKHIFYYLYKEKDINKYNKIINNRQSYKLI